MQKEAMNVLVKYLDVEEIQDLRDIFKSLDKNWTGALNFSELQQALHKAGIQAVDEEIDEIIQNIDVAGNGEIN